MLKVFSVLMNLILVGIALFLLSKYGMPRADEDDFWIMIVLVITPVITLYYLLFGVNEESWLQIYFRRKIAEEKKKLRQLEDHEDS